MSHSDDPVIGVLLAGGLARRMGGGDKCLLPLSGKPLLSHAIERLEPQTDALVLNANGDPARFAAFGLDVVPDSVVGYAGPLAGVLAGMEWAKRNRPSARWIATAASDTPFFPRDYVARLLEKAQSHHPAIAMAASGGREHPVFALWPVALMGDLRSALESGTRKILDWTDRHTTLTVTFDMLAGPDGEIDPFFNANRPEDLELAERAAEMQP
ncbi:MAG: molybdenum cofactor guanylyltransferase MobA [Dichotomicrobium sp.]